MTNSHPQNQFSYTQEDVQEIIQLAFARQTEEKEFSYQQLLEIADELQLSPECLKLAERDWQAKQGEIQTRQAFNAYRRTTLVKKIGNYAISNSFLVMIDFVNGHNLSWSLYILLFWGMKLGLDTWSIFHPYGEAYEQAYQQWYLKYKLKQSVNTLWNKWLKPLFN
ncbi:MAG: 2TM domain-containing protein [Nostocaceae cyanobacterium]|nr:2TM domain-containing protein [Nostocaceae cyanobacterium]